MYPLETVHAPFDAYGSKQIAKIKKDQCNQCIDSSPLSFLITGSFCLLTKGFFFFNRYETTLVEFLVLTNSYLYLNIFKN